MDAPTESDDGQAMAWMGMPTNDDHMPGMATDEQLDELAGSSRERGDDLFIDLMVAHHKGGIDMVELRRRARPRTATCSATRRRGRAARPRRSPSSRRSAIDT